AELPINDDSIIMAGINIQLLGPLKRKERISQRRQDAKKACKENSGFFARIIPCYRIKRPSPPRRKQPRYCLARERGFCIPEFKNPPAEWPAITSPMRGRIAPPPLRSQATPSARSPTCIR